MRLGQRLIRVPAVQRLLGSGLAGYLTLVDRTNRTVREPADIGAALRPHEPAIVAMWHGQHFMVPFARPPGTSFAVMISLHAEAEVNAIAAEKLGIRTIRASGSHRQREIMRKRGVLGFRECLRALEDGVSVGLTADVPKGPAKVAGRGIVLLAKHSGRPIVPVAYATSRAIDVGSWDEASVNLPFGRAGFVLGDPIAVPADADDDAVDEYRARVTAALDRATDRAYELAGVRSKFAGRRHG